MSKKKAVIRSDMTRAQWTWKEMKRNKVAYAMVAPYMLIFSLFTVVPVLLSVVMSFTDFNLLETPNIVWFENYIRLFLSPLHGYHRRGVLFHRLILSKAFR